MQRELNSKEEPVESKSYELSPEELKRRWKKKMWIFSGMLVLLCIPIVRVLILSLQKEEHQNPIVFETSASGNTILSFGNDQPGYLRNPDLSWFEKAFCLGYKKSSFCDDKFLHPFAQHYEDHYGIDLNKSIQAYKKENKNLALKTKKRFLSLTEKTRINRKF